MLTLTPTVFLADPDAAVRTTLTAMVRGAGWSSETCESAETILAHPRLSVPSCLVLDIGAPDPSSLELLRRLATEREETPIIAIANTGDIPVIVRVMKAGAVEFLLKPLTDETVLPAIRYALASSHAVLAQVAVLRELRNRYDSLSAREREVMTRVVAGNLNKHIGAALCISEITVKAHRGKVMRKMRAESLAELVAMALRLDLPTVPTSTTMSIASPHGVSTASRQSAHSRSLGSMSTSATNAPRWSGVSASNRSASKSSAALRSA